MTIRIRNQTAPGLSGQTRDQHLIYVVGPDTVDPSDSTDVVSVNLTGVARVSGIGDGTMRVRVYDDIRDAVGATGDTLLDKSGTLVTVARSIKVMPIPKTTIATVTSGFRQFSGAAGVDHLNRLGGLSLSIACHRGPTGAPLVGDADPTNDQDDDAACDTNRTDDATKKVVPKFASVNVAAAASGVKVSGDSGFAFAKATTFSMMADCSGGSAATFPKLADGKNNLAGPASTAVAVGATYLCVTVAPANATRIEPGTYSADVTLGATNANQPFAPMGMTDMTVATIKHDGTSVNIPFLTSYDGYVQRLVIVNRNKDDVSYKLAFHTEGSGTADPMMIEGMAKGGMATTLKVADEVTFSNPTRGSGTLDIVSSPAMVDVATTMVNTMDQSTDTVVLHLGKRDTNQ